MLGKRKPPGKTDISCANCMTNLGLDIENHIKHVKYLRKVTRKGLLVEKTYTKSVFDTLSIIYSAVYDSSRIFPSLLYWKESDDFALCVHCARNLVDACKALQDFSSVTREQSYIAKGLQHFFDELVQVDINAVSVDTAGMVNKRLEEEDGSGDSDYCDDSLMGSLPNITVKKEMMDGTAQSDASSDNYTGTSNYASQDDVDFHSPSETEMKPSHPPIKRRRGRPSKKNKLENSSHSFQSFGSDSNQDGESSPKKGRKRGPRTSKNDPLSSSSTPNVCTQCDKYFANQTTLKQHQILHREGDRPYDCTECKAILTKLSHLKRHWKAKHPTISDRLMEQYRVEKEKQKDSKTLKCSRCQKTFVHHDELCLHALQHSPLPKGFACDTCGKDFSKREYLKRHEREVHGSAANTPSSSGSISQYKCTFCRKYFDSLLELQCHLEEKHGERFATCVHCGIKFAANVFLLRHMAEQHPDEYGGGIEDDQENEDVGNVEEEEEVEIDEVGEDGVGIGVGTEIVVEHLEIPISFETVL